MATCRKRLMRQRRYTLGHLPDPERSNVSDRGGGLDPPYLPLGTPGILKSTTMERYDEDLNENSFLQLLRTDFQEVFERAVSEGWMICVPRQGALPKYAMSQEDFMGNILVRNDDCPPVASDTQGQGSQWRTLTDKTVILKGNVLMLEDELDSTHSVHILFDETFYDDDMQKYKVLCVEDSLCASRIVGDVSNGLIKILSLRDCIDLLWTETAGDNVLEKLESLVKKFLIENPNIEEETLQRLRDLASQLFCEAIQVALSDTRLNQKTKEDNYFLDTIKLAVETYVLHGVYKKLMKGVTACTAVDDSRLNRIVKNLSDLQVKDLDIDPEHSEQLTKSKYELASIDGYSTPLGKLGCIRRAITLIAVQGKVISADELIPILVFLVVKTNLPNWNANVLFLKLFRFSASSNQSGEHSFHISSIEASLQHILSGALFGSTSPEADCVLSADTPDNTGSLVLKSLDESFGNKGVDLTTRFFECVRLGKASEVGYILNGKYNIVEEIEECNVESDAQLCHPLCSCDKCEGLMSKPKKEITPTISTRDERGYTGLHVACIFGRPTVVEILLSQGSDIKSTDYRGATPLHYAAQKGHQNAVLLLLHAGADLNHCDNDDNTPLHLSSINGHENCVKALLFYAESMGTDIYMNAQNTSGDTPLHLACRWGYAGIVELILERLVLLGLSLKVRNNRKLTPIECAHNVHITRLIMDYQTKKDESNFQGFVRIGVINTSPPVNLNRQKSLDFANTPERLNSKRYSPTTPVELKQTEKMLKSVAIGDVKLSCYYLGISEDNYSEEEFVKPTTKCHPLCQCSSCTPRGLEVPSSSQNLAISSVNSSNSEGFTALHVAALQNHFHIIKVLLAHGADPNFHNRTKGHTPLHFAAQNSNIEIMKVLIAQGANPENKDLCGNTVLHYCCQQGFEEGVNLLLKLGVNKDSMNLSEKTPAQQAKDRGFWNIVKILFGTTTST
ncbi:unnamed protein product, partial [Meganyctiphanes norvegica]